MYVYSWVHTDIHTRCLSQIFTKPSNRLLGLNRMNEWMFRMRRTQITDTYVLCDSRGETISACVQDCWVSLGNNLEGIQQMMNLRHAIFILLSFCVVASLYGRNNARKQKADWKVGTGTADQWPQQKEQIPSFHFVKCWQISGSNTWFKSWGMYSSLLDWH